MNEDYLRFNLTRLLERYRGEGWYNDSPAYDYYSMWLFRRMVLYGYTTMVTSFPKLRPNLAIIKLT